MVFPVSYLQRLTGGRYVPVGVKKKKIYNDGRLAECFFLGESVEAEVWFGLRPDVEQSATLQEQLRAEAAVVLSLLLFLLLFAGGLITSFCVYTTT